MAKAVIQSAKFKKDYMMLLSFMLFFMIVAVECFLIVWLPWHLKLDNMWATEVTRLELIDAFDTLRTSCRSSSGKLQKPASAEVDLICRSLDRAAAYMHRYGKITSPRQCSEFKEIITKLQVQYNSIASGQTYSRSIELDNKIFLQKLRGVDLKKSGHKSRR